MSNALKGLVEFCTGIVSDEMQCHDVDDEWIYLSVETSPIEMAAVLSPE